MRILIICLLVASCSANTDKVKSVLENEGCTDVVDNGFVFFGCGKEDGFHNGFSCTKNNRKIEGVVCSGLLKGFTVRYN